MTILEEREFGIGKIGIAAIYEDREFYYQVFLFFSTDKNSIRPIVETGIESFVEAYTIFMETLNNIKDIESNKKII